MFRSIGNQAAFNDVLQDPENSDLTVYQLPEALFPPGGTYFSKGFANQRASVVRVREMGRFENASLLSKEARSGRESEGRI